MIHFAHYPERDLIDRMIQDFPDEIPTIDMSLTEASEWMEDGVEAERPDEENPECIARSMERSSHVFMVH